MQSRYGISIGHILHPTDFSHGSQVAFAHALCIALKTHGQLCMLHVDRGVGRADWDSYPSVRDTLSRWGVLGENATRNDVARLGVSVQKAVAKGKDPATGVLDHLNGHNADLVVMATHRREGIDRWLHREVAGRIHSETDAAALFIPYGVDGFVDEDTGVSRLSRILLPVDTNPNPRPAIEVSCDLVETISPSNTAVRLLHVGDPAGTPAVQLPDYAHCQWEWAHRSGRVVDGIVQEAEDFNADLIVMTTCGHNGFLDALRGSTTEQVLQHANVPVLAVHATDEQ